MRWDDVSCLVLPNPYVKGMDNVDDDVSLVRVEEVQKAFEIRWRSDAHFTQYVLVKADGTVFKDQARLNKPALAGCRSKGADIVARMMVFDFDLPGHARWTKELWGQVKQDWDAACVQHPLFERTAAWYSTRGGFRAVYLLAEPTPVDQLEALLKGMVTLFAGTTLAAYIDRRCFDWTRLFRLPRVLREGAFSDDGEFFVMDIQDEAQPILSTEIPRDMDLAAKQYGTVVRVDRVLDISPEIAKGMLKTPDGKSTEWYKQARSRLRGRDTLDFIDCARKLEENGQRNNTLQKLVGSTVSLLIPVEGTTPQLIYALWVDAVEQLEARTGSDSGKAWLNVLWEMVCRVWEKEASVVVATKATEQAKTEGDAKLSDIVLKGMRSWCRHPFLHSSDADGYEFVQRHAIVTFGGDKYHVLRSDGFYDPVQVSLVNVPGRVRELGMDSIIELTWLDDSLKVPKVKPVPTNVLLHRHSTLVTAREGVVGSAGSYIRDIESDAATFLFKMYARRLDLFPEWNADVEGWLRAFAGPDNYSALCAWIGHALNFEGGPICALSLNAPPGIGKKMLVEGLAECINTLTIADAKEMTGRFQSQVLRTPFLVVNEGLPRVGRDSATDPADAFRALVAGDTLHVEEKGKGIITVRNPMRVIITANNNTILRSLYAHRDLSPSDREALGKRLLHMDLSRSGAEWLTSKGGKEFTGRPGRRWIRGDDGAPSDLLVAKHFFWLYKHRPPVKTGNRFLIEGDPDSWIVREMAVSSGGSAEVIEAVLAMIDSQTKPEGIVIEDGQVYVTATGVRDFHANLAKFKGYNERMSLHRIGSVLHGLSAVGWEPTAKQFNNGPRMRWWLLDLDILRTMAEQVGNGSKKLRALLEERENRRILSPRGLT